MLIYEEHEQKSSDKFGVSLIKLASSISTVREHGAVDFKRLYSSKLSDDFKYPKGIVRETIDFMNIKVESIRKKNALDKYAIIHLHGGAYVLDFNDTYRRVAKKYLSLHQDLTVFSLIYSLAPKHPFPAALDESVGFYKYLLEKGFKSENIIIVGDSAGGGLAIATALFLRDSAIPLPKALITMSPWTNLAMNGKSHIENRHLDPLFGEGTKPLNVLAYTRRHSLTNPYISPKYGDYTSFTDMLMFVGGNELILSDTLDVADAAKDTNEVIVHNFLGMFHVFPLGFNKMHSSKTAWNIIKKYILEKLRG